MSDNIFNSSEQTPVQNQVSEGNATSQPSQSNSPFADLLGSIRNEKGEPKYRDVQTALDALKHSQEFIPQLKTENETLKTELERLKDEVTKLRAVEDTVSRLSSVQQQASTNAQGLDEKTVAELVNRTLTAREIEAIQKANITKVVNVMQQALGAEAEKAFYSKAVELGMQPQDINALAAKSPQAVLKLFGLDGTQKESASKTPSPISTGLNTSGYQQKPETFVRKSERSVTIGATTADLRAESENAKKLVEELHSNGLSTYDLTDPKQYFKFFN